MKVLWSGILSDASGGVIVRTVAGAEPTPKIADTITKWHTSQVSADPNHDQILFVAGNCPILISCRDVTIKVWISCYAIREVGNIFLTCCSNLLLGLESDKDWLSPPLEGELRAK